MVDEATAEKANADKDAADKAAADKSPAEKTTREEAVAGNRNTVFMLQTSQHPQGQFGT